MRRMTPAKRQAFVERLCDLTGVPVISKETVAAIDDCYRRSLDGERLSDDEPVQEPSVGEEAGGFCLSMSARRLFPIIAAPALPSQSARCPAPPHPRSRLIIVATRVGMHVMHVGMHDYCAPRPDATGAVDAPGTDHGIRVSAVDNHGRYERGDGESSECEQAHSCLLAVGFQSARIQFDAAQPTAPELRP